MNKVEIEKKLKENEVKKSESKANVISLFEKIDKAFGDWKPIEDDKIKKKIFYYKQFCHYKEDILKSIDDTMKIQPPICGFTVFQHLFEGPKPIGLDMGNLIHWLEEYCKYSKNDCYICNLEDSKPVHFSGDIIITDPCYLINKKADKDDWELCDYGYSLNNLGFTKYLQRDTIYGDWDCTVFDTKDKNKIYGHFCADSGEVCVVLADEAFNYNPDFEKEYLENRDWCATVIKDFEGDVYFRIDEDKFIYEDKECFDYDVKVIIDGVNKKTGEPIHLISSQTGL